MAAALSRDIPITEYAPLKIKICLLYTSEPITTLAHVEGNGVFQVYRYCHDRIIYILSRGIVFFTIFPDVHCNTFTRFSAYMSDVIR